MYIKTATVYHPLNVPNFITLVFVMLKLTHAINWSWLWVLFPTMIDIGIGMLIVAIGIAIRIVWRLK